MYLYSLIDGLSIPFTDAANDFIKPSAEIKMLKE